MDSWSRHDRILLRGAEVATSAGRRSADIYVRDGRIEAVGPCPSDPEAHVEDLAGLCVVPGFVDVHVHLRDPGAPDSETLESGLEAAARGGVHHLFCMANTDPVIDDPDLVANLVERARALSPLRLHPVAAVTRGLTGTCLTDYRALRDSGAGALSNDGLPVEDAATLRRALEAAERAGLPVFVHAEDRELAGGGALDARIAGRFDVRGIPVAAEDAGTARDLAVAAELGARLHVCHVSTAGALGLVRRARAEGLAVTAEATPHHLALSYDDIPGPDADFKMNPPLRAPSDVARLLEAVVDGTLDAIATDHAPHSTRRKAGPLGQAPFGAIGLETSFPVSYTALVASGRIGLERLLELYVDGPAAIAGIPAPRIEPGAPAQLNVLDLDAEWVVDPGQFASRSRNCPFKGCRLRSRVKAVLSGALLRRW